MFLRFVSLWAVLLLFKFCQAAVFQKNSTTPATPASTISGSAPSTITTSATLSYENVVSTTELFPVTPGPYWGNQTIPINTCTSWNLNGNKPQLVWIPCHIFAGTVQLSYFPPASGNITYPSTYYNEAMGITMTSPSMYMVINTISGYNSCGQVGPTMSNIVVSLDPSHVSTIALYTASDQHVNTTPAQLLTLNDIISGCSTITMTEASTNGAIQNYHAMANDYNRCFPALAIPTPLIESLGLPYYRHCGQDNARLGLFDPPGAVPPANALLPVTSASPATSTSMPASTAQLPSPNQPSKTTTANELQPSTSTSASLVQASDPVSQDHVAPNVQASSSNVLSTAVLAVLDATNTVDSPQPKSSSAIVPANNPISIATIDSSVISAVPGDSIVVVAGQTASLGGVPITISSSLVQLTPSGLVVANINNDSSQSSVYAIPTAKPVTPAVTQSKITTLVGGEVISAIPGASHIVVAGQTITSGAPAIRLPGSNSVAGFGSEGLVIQESDGSISTFSIPTFSPTPIISSSKIATLTGGEIISAGADASTLILGSQTISLNGPLITLSDSAIATLGTAGLTLQYAGGVVSTFPLPTSKPLAIPKETSITEIRTSEIIIYSSGRAVTTYYSTFSNGKGADTSSTSPSTSSESEILAIQSGNGNAKTDSTSTGSADTNTITNIFLMVGLNKNCECIEGFDIAGSLGVMDGAVRG